MLTTHEVAFSTRFSGWILWCHVAIYKKQNQGRNCVLSPRPTTRMRSLRSATTHPTMLLSISRIYPSCLTPHLRTIRSMTILWLTRHSNSSKIPKRLGSLQSSTTSYSLMSRLLPLRAFIESCAPWVAPLKLSNFLNSLELG